MPPVSVRSTVTSPPGSLTKIPGELLVVRISPEFVTLRELNPNRIDSAVAAGDGAGIIYRHRTVATYLDAVVVARCNIGLIDDRDIVSAGDKDPLRARPRRGDVDSRVAIIEPEI